MPKITIPTSKNWIISHKGEFNGNVIRSYNADFGTYPGSIAPATRMYPHTTTDDASTSTMTLPTDFIVSFADNQVKLWSVADKVYKTSSESINMFAADTLVDSPTALVDPDIAILGRIGGSDNLIVTRRTDLSRFNYSVSPTNWKVNWWTDTVVNGGLNQPALSNTDPVILETFGNTLLIGNGLNVHSIILNNDGTFSVAYQRLVFSGPRVINWIKATKSRIYIGLKSRYGDTFASTVVEYDLINEIVREMEIEDGTSIGFVYNDNIHIIDNKTA